jgi:hypothetical protein
VENVLTPDDGPLRVDVVTTALETPFRPDRVAVTPVVAELSTLAVPDDETVTLFEVLAVTFEP